MIISMVDHSIYDLSAAYQNITIVIGQLEIPKGSTNLTERNRLDQSYTVHWPKWPSTPFESKIGPYGPELI